MLTDRQRQDLHIAILEYLRDGGEALAKTAEVFESEAGLGGGGGEGAVSSKGAGGGGAASTGMLEKKWTSVVRLQKKVLELEERLAAAEAELKTARGHPYGLGGAARPPTGGGGGSDGTLTTRNLPRAPAVRTLVGHRGGITCLATHPVFALLVSGSEDATIKTWDLETGEYEKTLKGHTNAIQALTFNRAGTLLASCSSDLSIKLWDFGPTAAPECLLRTLRGHDHNISGLAFLPSGDQLLSCSRDTTLKFWETSTGYCLRTLTHAHTDWVRCVCVSADGTLIASGGNDQSVVVWQVATGQPLFTLKEHTHVVESVAFPPLGTEVKIDEISASSATSTSTSTKTHTHTHTYLVSGSRDKTVKLWDATTGTCVLTFQEHDNWVRAVCFHPSGLYILSCSDDRSVRVYDIQKKRCIRTLGEAHTQFVTCLCQHVKLPYVVTGGVEREIKVWETR